MNSGSPGNGDVASTASLSASVARTARWRSTCRVHAVGDLPERLLDGVGQMDGRRPAKADRAARHLGDEAVGVVHRGAEGVRRADRPDFFADPEIELVREHAGGGRGPRRPPSSPNVGPLPGESDRVGDGGVDPGAGAAGRRMDRCDEQLREPSRVDLHAVAARLIGKVGRDHDRQPELATGEREGQVTSKVARVGDHEDRVGRLVEEQPPEGLIAGRLVGQRSGSREVDEPRGPAAGLDLPSLQMDGGPRRVGGLDEVVAGAGQERGLADVRAAHEDDRGQPFGHLLAAFAVYPAFGRPHWASRSPRAYGSEG